MEGFRVWGLRFMVLGLRVQPSELGGVGTEGEAQGRSVCEQTTSACLGFRV